MTLFVCYGQSPASSPSKHTNYTMTIFSQPLLFSAGCVCVSEVQTSSPIAPTDLENFTSLYLLHIAIIILCSYLEFLASATVHMYLFVVSFLPVFQVAWMMSTAIVLLSAMILSLTNGTR